ncbi:MULTISPECIES: DUF4389 domain-containing protein [Nocardioides]|uniref:DUF4389 domain-containing protein n=1 Tax=Nocardioides vastitatis TaxID=2568655 RepID=A0ABW0ZIM6_9ACTN|nr:DUF4389 domain-containing protein [Nocardioides sp.]THJ06226.1 DUF4389 domain-containing protein [Nocardioides sp.]
MSSSYPVAVRATLQPDLSRWLWTVKWAAVLPHYVILVFLWAAYVVLTAVALGAILVSGRYPRAIFEFNVGVLRWTWRVAYYAYGGLGTDQYPPFTLESRPDYPADLEVTYPERLSRGLALVKWWLLATPHYLVVGLLLGGGWYAASEGVPFVRGLGLIEILVIVAGVVLLVTGSYPRPVFDLVLGLNRWVIRVVTYASLMTDTYPPFRLDQGSDEPGGLALDRSRMGVTAGADAGVQSVPTTSPEYSHQPPPSPHWGAGRVFTVVVASLAILVAALLLLGGLALRLVDSTARDADGFLTGVAVGARSEGHAVVSEDIEIQLPARYSELPDRLVGEVKIEARADGHEVFIGVAESEDLRTYLDNVRYSAVREVIEGREVWYVEHRGTARPVAPGTVDIWVESVQGRGRQALVVDPNPGEWAVAVMRADGAAPVDVDVRVGASVPWVGEVALALLACGVLAGAAGAVGLRAALRPKSG